MLHLFASQPLEKIWRRLHRSFPLRATYWIIAFTPNCPQKNGNLLEIDIIFDP